MARKRGQPRPFLNYEMDRRSQSDIASLIGHTTVLVGIPKRKIKSEAHLWEIISAMFDLSPMHGELFMVSVRRILKEIKRIPTERRREMARKGAVVLGKEYGLPPARIARIVLNSSLPTSSVKDEFYASWEWRTLRMKVLKEYGRICMCCGARPSDKTMGGTPVKIVVDHIKPLAHFWHLRLDKTNLQVLCDECNQGKGAWDETDYRAA